MKNFFANDPSVNIRAKIASLWTAVMFCFVYGDFFSLFVPGRIENLNTGSSGVGTTTPIQLLLFALLMTPAILMVYFSLVLNAGACRIVNIIVGLFYSVVMALVVISSLDKWMLFYTYLGCLEIILTLLIVKLSWTALGRPDR